MAAAVEGQLRSTQLLGRKTYESFAQAGPAREAAGGDDAPLAARIGDTRKIVVSSRKLAFTWRNSEQLEGSLIEAVTALKDGPGDDIAISGSSSIVRQLLDAALIDELHLFVDPIVVRHGMRLFADGPAPLSEERDRATEPGRSAIALTAGRPVEQYPTSELGGEAFEAVHVACSYEQKRPSFYRATLEPIEEHARASGHDVNLIAIVRLLLVGADGRVHLDHERSVRKNWHRQVSGRRRALSKRLQEADVESIGRHNLGVTEVCMLEDARMTSLAQRLDGAASSFCADSAATFN